MKKQFIPFNSFIALFNKLYKIPMLGIGFVLLVIFGFKSTMDLQNPKIAVVDLERVMVLSNAGKALQQKLEKFQQDAQNEGNRLSQDANAIRQRVADGANSLSQDKLAELQKQFEDKQIEIRRFQDDKQREGEKMRNEELQKIEAQMGPVIEALTKQMNIDLLLNNTPGITIYVNERLDLTDQVVVLMNQ